MCGDGEVTALEVFPNEVGKKRYAFFIECERGFAFFGLSGDVVIDHDKNLVMAGLLTPWIKSTRAGRSEVLVSTKSQNVVYPEFNKKVSAAA